MAWGKILLKIVGMICPPGKPHSGNFFGRRFFDPIPSPHPPWGLNKAECNKIGGFV